MIPERLGNYVGPVRIGPSAWDHLREEVRLSADERKPVQAKPEIQLADHKPEEV